VQIHPDFNNWDAENQMSLKTCEIVKLMPCPTGNEAAVTKRR